MPKVSPKDKAFHANGSMTAAEYKRRFLNKAAVKRATSQVEVRTNVGQMTGVPSAVKQRLRDVHIRAEPNPGDFYNARQLQAAQACEPMAKLRKGRNSSHVVTSI